MMLDVCVVGGGISGLAACQRLQDAGLSFTLLEAKDRIGGRFKAHTKSDFIYDEGAHWLHCADWNPLVDVLRPQSPIYVKQPSEIFFGTPFRFLSERENRRIWRYYREVWAQIGSISRSGQDRSVSTLIKDEHLGMYFSALFASSVGSLPHRVSAKDVGNYVDTEIDFAVESGLGRALSQAFSQLPVQLGQKVVEVERGTNVRVRMASGETVTARCCLLTASPPAVKKITFTPPLPEAHRNSLDTIRMGLLETLAMEFYEDVFEGPGNVHLYLGISRGPQLSYLIKPAGRNVAVAYLAGEAIHAIAGDTQRLVESALTPLARLYQFDPKRDVRRAVLSDWTRDADVMGALSYAPVGHVRARSDLKVPVDWQLYFAGEATSLTAPASLHGAYQEGFRAADEAVRAMG
jgi:monoamine oxidase